MIRSWKEKLKISKTCGRRSGEIVHPCSRSLIGNVGHWYLGTLGKGSLASGKEDQEPGVGRKEGVDLSLPYAPGIPHSGEK